MRFISMVFAAFLLFGGVYDSYTSWKNPEPVAMTVAEFAALQDAPAYVTLTDAEINLLSAVVVTSSVGKKVSRLYIPIEFESEDIRQEQGISLVLNSVDKEFLRLANELYALAEGEQLQYFAQHSDELIRQEALSGRVVSAGSMSSDREEEVRELMDDLADDFSVLNHGGKPSLVRGVTMAGIGILLFLPGLLRKKKKTSAGKS